MQQVNREEKLLQTLVFTILLAGSHTLSKANEENYVQLECIWEYKTQGTSHFKYFYYTNNKTVQDAIDHSLKYLKEKGFENFAVKKVTYYHEDDFSSIDPKQTIKDVLQGKIEHSLTFLLDAEPKLAERVNKLRAIRLNPAQQEALKAEKDLPRSLGKQKTENAYEMLVYLQKRKIMAYVKHIRVEDLEKLEKAIDKVRKQHPDEKGKYPQLGIVVTVLLVISGSAGLLYLYHKKTRDKKLKALVYKKDKVK